MQWVLILVVLNSDSVYTDHVHFADKDSCLIALKGIDAQVDYKRSSMFRWPDTAAYCAPTSLTNEKK